jgi:hypothetical protein
VDVPCTYRPEHSEVSSIEPPINAVLAHNVLLRIRPVTSIICSWNHDRQALAVHSTESPYSSHTLSMRYMQAVRRGGENEVRIE